MNFSCNESYFACLYETSHINLSVNRIYLRFSLSFIRPFNILANEKFNQTAYCPWNYLKHVANTC